MDHRNSIIGGLVRGRSFAEVGGLWGAVNEKTTVAHQAGASDLCQIDIWPSHSEWWEKFRAKCDDLGLPSVREVIGSIDSRKTLDLVGSYEIVHCSGVIYHCPNPLLTISNLRSITKQTLIVAVAVMPNHIKNERGSVDISDEAAICIPCIDERSRMVMDLYTKEKYGGNAWGLNDKISTWYFSDNSPNYGPWWWLWTAEYFKRLLSCSGFDVVADYSQFDGTGHLYVCNKVKFEEQNYGLF
jgi:hypothetical protein